MASTIPGPLNGLLRPPFDLGTLVRTQSPLAGPIGGVTTPQTTMAQRVEDIALIKQALPYAYIAQAVYQSNLVCSASNAVWEIVADSVVRKHGFLCALYKRESENVLAFAGTDPKSLSDWITDLQNLALGSGQQGQAYKEIFELLPKKSGSSIIVGHSLGGNLAILASLASGWPCYTFNTEGLGSFMWLVAHLDKWLHKIPNSDVFNFVTAADNPLVRLTRILPLPGRKILIPDNLGTILFHPIRGHFMEHVIARMEALTAGR